MKRNLYLDPSILLSPFDLEGLLLKKDFALSLSGLERDYNKLHGDLEVLKADYKKACERLNKEVVGDQ